MDDKKRAALIEAAGKQLWKKVPDEEVLASIMDLGVEENDALKLLEEAKRAIATDRSEPYDAIKTMRDIKEQVAKQNQIKGQETDVMEELEKIEKKIDIIDEKISKKHGKKGKK